MKKGGTEGNGEGKTLCPGFPGSFRLEQTLQRGQKLAHFLLCGDRLAAPSRLLFLRKGLREAGGRGYQHPLDGSRLSGAQKKI